jgi:predicted nuclease with TOPRIM domain
MSNRIKTLVFPLLTFAVLSLAACGVPQGEHNAVKTERDAAVADGVRLQGEKDALDARLATASAERDAANVTVAALEGDAEQASVQIASLESERDLADGRIADLESDVTELADAVATLEASQSDLLEAIGDVESLEAQRASLETTVTDLMAEIADLRRQRTPLIPDTYTVGFLCTGSMDPEVTCMDEAVWLDNFAPEEIVIGAVIAFDATGLGCKIASARVAHRVIDIKVESGVYLYLTKGDNNRGDDGCWIPESSVFAYMTELIENDYADMQALLNQIWPLEAQEKALLDDIDRLEAEYDAADAEYDQLLQDHCTFSGGQWTCPGSWYQVALDQFNHLNTLVSTINARLDQYVGVCEEVRALRIQLQSLHDNYFGPTSYVFPACS